MEDLKPNRYASVLSIAGSDSGGCAGIQADIKSISACGGFAATVITATTAQNTCGVTDIHPIPVEHIARQLDAVLSDIRFGAVKIGMLHDCDVIRIVRQKIEEYKLSNIVLDPVMVATSGDQLISTDAVSCLRELFPLADLITPNLPEAELLLDSKIEPADMEKAAANLAQRSNTSVLLKGGHLPEGSTIKDVLYTFPAGQTYSFRHAYIATNNTHGTGCTLSSSIATYLSLGLTLHNAVERGCDYIHKAIREGSDFQLGKGHGPVNHFGLVSQS